MKFTKEKKDEELIANTLNKKSQESKETKEVTKKTSTKNKIKKDSTRKNETRKTSTSKNETVNKTKKTSTSPFKSALLSRNKTKKSDENINTIETSRSDSKTTSKKSNYTVYNEYYDLPYRYNQTIIKILAQTPHSIFVYWDISDSDRAKMKEIYGPHVFEDTIPVLLIHNNTTNYSYLIEINDFANSWYIKTPTADCSFTIELGRKKVENRNETKISTPNNIVYISTSNNLILPNDRFLTETLSQKIYFKNTKTNKLEEANITDLTPINQVYTYLKNDILNNPSSNFKF